MEKIKDFLGFVSPIPFDLFASCVINLCDCEPSIFDDVSVNSLQPVDAEYTQM